MTQDKDNTLCCAQCGNIHVQLRVWVDINTNEIISDCEDNEGWCNECGAMVRYCTVTEFENNNPMSNCN